MRINDFEIYFYKLFGVNNKITGKLEITCKYKNTISKIGYATNITPDVIREAKINNVDLIVTHHDAWHFIFGLKNECHRLLKKNKINHVFVHSPLDSCDFGTNATLINNS
jgi:putative NIF3 family GTP cyclohydrolase 1 type 2